MRLHTPPKKIDTSIKENLKKVIFSVGIAKITARARTVEKIRRKSGRRCRLSSAKPRPRKLTKAAAMVMYNGVN